MDHGTWLWKKKSVEKTIVANDKTGFSLKGNQEEMLHNEKEAALERSMKTLNEKLASLLGECNAKDDLVASHSKVAQEAIAGQEKAEAEVTHLKAALKDCMQQLSSAREEQDQKVRESVTKASKELEKEHKKLEDKFVETSRRVANLTVENSQLTKALLVKEKLIDDASEQMSHATGEFNILMARLDSTEKENAFLKYEFQMLEKELEIRNEAMEFNRRSAEAWEKKYLESVKKISKSEAECQRLRVLVRKRLPGPAALAKMKSEVEMQGSNYHMEIKRNPREVPDKRIDFMVERLCDVKEENKILKEIAASKDDELRSLRTTFALLASKLSQVEDQLGIHSKREKSMELIDGSGSWASALLCQMENFKEGDTKKSSGCKMIGVSEMSLMDDFAEMEKLAIVSVDSQSGNSCDTTGKEIIPVTQFDSIDMESKDLSTEKPSDRLQNVLKAILEETRVSKRSIDEIFEDIRVALKYTDQLGPATDAETSEPLPISGYITWNSSDSTGMENQVGKSEQSIERLQSELERVLESKRLVEDQIENQKLINEDLDTQLSVSKSQLNVLLQKLSSLEVELEDRSHCCEALEATCLELQLQLESISSKELPKGNEEQEEKLFQTGWEITCASAKLAECQETILKLGKQLKALASPTDKVLSKTDEKTLSQQRSSLRDRMLAEDGVEAQEPNSKTKEIISTTETKIVPLILHSNSGRGFYQAKTTVPGALAIVPSKKQGGGNNLLKKLLFRRKKGSSKKKPSLPRVRSTREI